MAVFVARNAPWMQWIVPERFNDADLFKIVTFFVFHSPCPEQSSMGKSLEEYGWKTPWRKPFYLGRHLRKASSNYNLLFSAKSYDAMDEALAKAELKEDFPNDLGRERICIYDCQKNQFLSVLYHLRNSFAHCRLNIVDVNGECVFILEDVQSKKDKDMLRVSARMILRKSTLLKWIEIIEAGEKEWRRDKTTKSYSKKEGERK